MAIGINSSYKEDTTQYITLDSKEDIVRASKKLSFRDKRYVEIKISEEKIKRINNKKKK
jgi:hypothetical protein